VGNIAKVKSLFDQYYEKVKQKPQIWIGFAILLTAILVLWRIPIYQVSQYPINNATEQATLENQFRTTLAQIFGGVAIGIGLYYTWRRIMIAESNLKAFQDGQITERFTRAIDQLGNRKLEIRLGGIYALERISIESKEDYWPIMEILTAYVRNNSSVKIMENKKIMHISMDIQANKSTIKEVSEINELKLDIQAVLTVIRRRKDPIDTRKNINFNLQRTYLRNADLMETNLKEADFEEADLRGANFRKTRLGKAHFEKAHLEGSNLIFAHLKGAHLEKAHLEGACLEEAHLEGAHLEGAHFEGADLVWTQLEGADLREVHFEDADLSHANLNGAQLKWAQFEGADLSHADLRSSYSNAPSLSLEGLGNGLTPEQLYNVFSLYEVKLDEKLEKSLRETHSKLIDEQKPDGIRDLD
jgi:hypothetical protein